MARLEDRRARRLRRKLEKRRAHRGIELQMDENGCYDAREVYAKAVTEMLDAYGIYARYGRDVYLQLARDIPEDDEVGFHRTYDELILDAIHGDDKRAKTLDILRAGMAHERGERMWL